MAVFICAAYARIHAAETYYFQSTTEGLHSKHQEGTVLIDGKRWRINFDPVPGDVTDFNAIVGTEDGRLIAINDSNRTWFDLKSLSRVEIDSSLFTFFAIGQVTKAAKIRIAEPIEPARGRGDAAGFTKRITFSYRIDVTVSSENVPGEVWGEIRLWVKPGMERRELPWKVMYLKTGIDAVDEALQAPLSKVGGLEWKSETEVSRRLAGGEILKQVIRRTIGPLTSTAADPLQFAVPSGYRYQEPVVGF